MNHEMIEPQGELDKSKIEVRDFNDLQWELTLKISYLNKWIIYTKGKYIIKVNFFSFI